MRAENEKRNVVKSLKMTKQQEELIMKKAKEQNMSFSSYVLSRAIHDNSELTPEIVSIIQEIVNQIQNCSNDLKIRQNTERQMKRLWEIL